MTDQPGNDDAGRGPNPSGEPSPLDFDPYRFGKPEHPIPPEYAPPGYLPPTSKQPAAPDRPVWPPQDSPGPQGYPPQQPYGGYQPPQQPYGGYTPHPPPPPGYPPYGQARPGNGKATTAMVLGIIAIPFFWLTLFDLAVAVPAIVLGALAIRDANRLPDRAGRGKGMAGLICGIVAVVLVVVTLVVVYTRLRPCLDYGFNSGRYQSCVNQKL
jgi:hypothetical protein